MKWKNRIVGQRMADPKTLKANAANWRIHPEAQRKALAEVLDTVGWVDQILVNRTTGNMIDGHLRVDEAIAREEAEVPVLEVELSEEEERLVLATLDPLSAMAATDWEKLEDLIEDLPDVARLWEQHNEDEHISKHWRGMPEYESEDQKGVQIIIVHFETREDVERFAELMGQNITDRTKWIWYPAKERLKEKGKSEYVSES